MHNGVVTLLTENNVFRQGKQQVEEQN